MRKKIASVFCMALLVFSVSMASGGSSCQVSQNENDNTGRCVWQTDGVNKKCVPYKWWLFMHSKCSGTNTSGDDGEELPSIDPGL